MADLIDKPATIRIGEELNVEKLEPYLREKFPTAETSQGTTEAAQIKERHAGGASGEGCGDGNLAGRCCPHVARSRARALGGRR